MTSTFVASVGPRLEVALSLSFVPVLSSVLSLASIVGIWISAGLRPLLLPMAHIVHILGEAFRMHCLGSLSDIEMLFVAMLLVSSSWMLGLAMAIPFSVLLLFMILILLARFREGRLAQLAQWVKVQLSRAWMLPHPLGPTLSRTAM